MRLSEVKSLNLSLVCLRVFASFIGIAGAARTPSVGRRAHAASGCKPEFSQKGYKLVEPGRRQIISRAIQCSQSERTVEELLPICCGSSSFG